jgi:GntR family transcriptional regulator, transcriptional repressor for pyruvate dehydrogenase complex
MRGQLADGIFTEVPRAPTLSDSVASSIAEAIMSGRLKPGEELHSERDLAEQFRVSRTVIREAIRSLAAQGLVESRSGRRVQVASAGPDGVNRSMSLFLRSNTAIDYAKVHEVRSALEVRMAAAAAERASDEDLRALRTLLKQLEATDDAERAAKLDVEFHLAIATATGNELFGVVLGSIGEVLLEARRAAFATPGMLDYAVRAHEGILDSLERRDPGAASEAMRVHLADAEQAWLGAKTLAP